MREPGERGERRDDVAVGHRLLRQAVLLRERKREVPADDEREAEHDAVRVDGQVRRVVGDALATPRGAAGRRSDHDRPTVATIVRWRRTASTRENDGDGGHRSQPPPELEGQVRERDAKEDRVHGSVLGTSQP